MDITIIPYQRKYVNEATQIWNTVVIDGIAFPQTETMELTEADSFFASQDFTALAIDKNSDVVLGLYILHPNNIGRCGHIGNASYAVKKDTRGLHVGEKLVIHSKIKAKKLGFKLMQFNAVVKTNYGARHLYKKLGFIELGTIPKGFKLDCDKFEDIILYYCEL